MKRLWSFIKAWPVAPWMHPWMTAAAEAGYVVAEGGEDKL